MEKIICIYPYAHDRSDPLAVEGMWNALAGVRGLKAEIWADGEEGKFFALRVPEGKEDFVVSIVQGVYPHAFFKEIDDPAKFPGERVEVEVGMERDGIYPLRTFREMNIDPVVGLLGGMEPREGERVCFQLEILPLPRGWADRWQGTVSTVEQKVLGARDFLTVLFLSASSALFFFFFFIFFILLFLKKVLWAFSAAMMGFFFFLLFYLAKSSISAAAPEEVKRKINLPAVKARIRILGFSERKERAWELVKGVITVLRQYDLAGGNALRPGGKEPILSVEELTSMWRFPGGEMIVPKIRWNQVKIPPPVPESVSRGALVGIGRMGIREIPVKIPWEALERNTFIHARTQQGKTNLMLLLLKEYMEKGDWCVVFIDPHGDGFESALGIIPSWQVPSTWVIDFSRLDRIVPLNFFDLHSGGGASIAEDLVGKIIAWTLNFGRILWYDYWGPRMENVWSYTARTIIDCNKKLPREKQFTLLDIPSFLMGENASYIRDILVTDLTLFSWWENFWRSLVADSYLKMQVISPVITKINALSLYLATRLTLGLPERMIDFTEILRKRGILLVNLAIGRVGEEVAKFVGVLILSFIEGAVREFWNMEKEERPKVVIVVDEAQFLPYNWQAFLGELMKFGVRVILGTQSITQMKEALGAEVVAAIKANVSNFFIFQSSADCASSLIEELGVKMESPEGFYPADIVGLGDHECYVRFIHNGKPVPPFWMKTIKVQEPSEEIKRRVMERREEYSLPLEEAMKKWMDKAFLLMGRREIMALGQKLSFLEGMSPEEIFEKLKENMPDEVSELVWEKSFPSPHIGGPLPEGIPPRRRK